MPQQPRPAPQPTTFIPQRTFYDPYAEETKQYDHTVYLDQQFTKFEKLLMIKKQMFDKWHMTFKGLKQPFDGIYHIELDLRKAPHEAPKFKFLCENGAFHADITYNFAELIAEWNTTFQLD